MNITPYTRHEADQVARLYHASIHAISSDLYTLDQLEAWAPTPPDLDFWRERLARTQPHLCWINDKLAGFIELEDGGYIDCLYTHPEYQGRGVATTLYQHAENLAIKQACETLTVDASKVAKKFFLHQGFLVHSEHQVERKEQVLVNFHMIKQLTLT